MAMRTQQLIIYNQGKPHMYSMDAPAAKRFRNVWLGSVRFRFGFDLPKLFTFQLHVYNQFIWLYAYELYVVTMSFRDYHTHSSVML